jgi:ornithine cyclodeaminase/alanine dehydrogenase-like protein (mu-crystallin family)
MRTFDAQAIREAAAIAVFKSVGLAIQDLAAVELIAGHLLPDGEAPTA